MNKEQIIEILRLCDSITVNNIIKITQCISGIPEKFSTELLQAKSIIFSS
jgi:hypothetical protein